MRCERCSAKDGVKHPAGGFVVKLEQITIDGTEKHLCQKCKAREQVHRNQKEPDATYPTFKKVISKLIP